MNTATETKSICFHTNTEIDPASWEMLGVSAKDNENAVGKFGTGLSISVAGLLRLGQKVSIYSNGAEYHFTAKEMSFRGKEFKRIYCNDTPLSFTTHLGFQWETWMFYRELVSNTMDEGGIWFASDTPMEDGTSIIVTGDEFAQCLADHDQYFVGDREPLMATDRFRIYSGAGTIYYQGIKVGVFNDAAYSYEIMSATLTEDRTVNPYSAASTFSMELCHCTDRKVIDQFLKGKHNKLEDNMDYDWTWSAEFQAAVKAIYEVNPTKLPTNIRKLMKKRAPDAALKEIPLGEKQKHVDRAVAFLDRAGFNVTSPIKMIENEDDSLVAMYKEGNIYLCERSFEKGMHYLVTTILEEHAHSLGHRDCCRGFQDWLLDQTINQAAKRLNEML